MSNTSNTSNTSNNEETKIIKKANIWLNAYKRTKKDLDMYKEDYDKIKDQLIETHTKKGEEEFSELCLVIENCTKMIEKSKENLEILYKTNIQNNELNHLPLFDEISFILESS
jgi:hypothetical protein